VDFYVKFTLRQWTRRVERAHIFFSNDDGGQDKAVHKATGGSFPPCYSAGAAHGTAH